MTSRQQGSGSNGTSGGRGWQMLRPHVEELVRRLSMESDGVAVHVRPSGAVTLTWTPPSLPHPVVLSLREDDLAQIVTDFGRDGGDDLWPGAGTRAAGFNLLLAHLYEVIATTDTTEVVRLTRDGRHWPTSPRDGYPP